MMWQDKLSRVLLFAGLLWYLNPNSFTYAQVVPDNSLGNSSSIVTPDVRVKGNLVDLIEGGAIRENNLFHSFSEFNIPDGDKVYFSNPDNIVNIFTRVTGNNLSEIFGTLGVNGEANLFLLNPNGIVFGENASLDINGSFLATTAESYIFGEGLEYSAISSNTPPLLTINIPPGLQMNSNSGKITIQNKGNSIVGGNLFPLMINNSDRGLQIKPGKTIGLIGGEINLTGGIIRGNGGNIRLNSTKEGIVKLDDNFQIEKLDTSQQLGDIKLSDKALLDSSGLITGEIKFTGNNIIIEDASVISIQNYGDLPSGNIIVKATGSIQLSGTVRNAPDLPSGTSFGDITGVSTSKIFTESHGTGKGGDIIIDSGNLFVFDGGRINTRSFSEADTGSVKVNVDELIKIDNYSQLNPGFFSFIGISVFGNSLAGEIDISAQNINILNGGSIAVYNYGNLQGGDIKVSVSEDLTVSGFIPEINTPSTLGGVAFRMGDSGRVTIDVARLSIFDGAGVGTVTLGLGNAGELVVNASDYIEISGSKPRSALISGLQSDAPIFDRILIKTFNLADIPSGDSGNVTLNTPSLIITDGGQVSVSNQGLGNSGDLNINSDNLVLDSESKITALSASGQAGNINLEIQNNLLLRNSSAITSETKATLQNRSIDGGNIAISSDTVTLLESSKITANANEGNGGNINIATLGLFRTSDSLITASSQFGLDGNIKIDNINSDRKLELPRLAENFIDLTQQMTTGCRDSGSHFANTGKGAFFGTKYQSMAGNRIWDDLRSINSSKNITNSNKKLFITNDRIENSIIEAQYWTINERGNLELLSLSSSEESQYNPIHCHHYLNNYNF